MIHVIMGLKGSGKTKKLIDSINAAVEQASGDVVCIEYGKKLTTTLPIRFAWWIPRSMVLAVQKCSRAS